MSEIEELHICEVDQSCLPLLRFWFPPVPESPPPLETASINISVPPSGNRVSTMATKPFGAHPVTAEPLTLTTVTSRPRGLIEVSFTNVGASIVSWKIGRIAKKTELVLGFDDGAAYLAPPSQNPYFGM